MAEAAGSRGLGEGEGGGLKRFWQWLRTLAGQGEEATLRESLEDIIDEHDESSDSLGAEERAMLKNILSFGEKRVEDVMVPRAEIVALGAETPLNEALKVFGAAGHSRLPLYRGSLDDPIGMLHLKDVAAALAGSAGDDETTLEMTPLVLRRDVLFVPPSMPVLDLLLKMQSTRIHLALVIDEYGGTDGLVSIEDLIEEIVGEIEDEHDEERPLLERRPNGGIDADARAPVEDLEELLGVSLVPEEWQDEIDTLGGLVFFTLGRVPQRGELVRHEAGIEFEVIEADARRIKRLRVHLPDEVASEG